MKKIYPKIKFDINKDFEKKFFHIFGVDGPFSNRAIAKELRFILESDFKNSRKKILSAYIDNYYNLYKKELEKDIEKTRKNWEKKEKYFYKQVDKIFKNYSWPKGNYRGYISIWNMFPRFIKTKEFSFPYCRDESRRSKINIVIAHEMLHFIAYDYLSKVHNLKSSESSYKDNRFWQFTENLNVLIENEKSWKYICNVGKSKPYDDCKDLYKEMYGIWKKDKDLDNLVIKIFNK